MSGLLLDQAKPELANYKPNRRGRQLCLSEKGIFVTLTVELNSQSPAQLYAQLSFNAPHNCLKFIVNDTLSWSKYCLTC